MTLLKLLDSLGYFLSRSPGSLAWSTSSDELLVRRIAELAMRTAMLNKNIVYFVWLTEMFVDLGCVKMSEVVGMTLLLRARAVEGGPNVWRLDRLVDYILLQSEDARTLLSPATL